MYAKTWCGYYAPRVGALERWSHLRHIFEGTCTEKLASDAADQIGNWYLGTPPSGCVKGGPRHHVTTARPPLKNEK